VKFIYVPPFHLINRTPNTMTPFLGLDPVFPPLGAASPRDQASWPDSKVMSSSGGLASNYWEEELSSKLAAKLLMLEGAQEDPRRRPTELECWGEDFLNTSYRSANPRFKTEICRNFKEKGTCLYGELCQFAHGKHEVQRDVARHAKYKTKLCQKYWIAGYCAYGPRCNFIHQEIEREAAMRLLAMGGAEARGGAVYRALKPFVRPGSSQAADSGSSSDSDDQARAQEGGGLQRHGRPLDLLDFYSEPPPPGPEVSEVAGLLPANFGLFNDFAPADPRHDRPQAIGSERGGPRDIWAAPSFAPSAFADPWRGCQ